MGHTSSVKEGKGLVTTCIPAWSSHRNVAPSLVQPHVCNKGSEMPLLQLEPGKKVESHCYGLIRRSDSFCSYSFGLCKLETGVGES